MPALKELRTEAARLGIALRSEKNKTDLLLAIKEKGEEFLDEFETPLELLTKELVSLARRLGLRGASHMRKESLIEDVRNCEDEIDRVECSIRECIHSRRWDGCNE